MLDYTISLVENALEVFGTLVGDSKHCNIMVHIFAAVEAEEGKLQQLLQFLRILGHQNLSCLLQVQDSEQPFPQVLLFHTNPCATYHHPLHQHPVSRCQAIPDKATIAQPDEAQLLHWVGSHYRRDRSSPVVIWVPNEDKVWHIHIEVRCEDAYGIPPLTMRRRLGLCWSGVLGTQPC